MIKKNNRFSFANAKSMYFELIFTDCERIVSVAGGTVKYSNIDSNISGESKLPGKMVIALHEVIRKKENE